MKMRFISSGLLLLVGLAVLMPLETSAASTYRLAVGGVNGDRQCAAVSFIGSVIIDKFVVQNGQLAMQGTLTGTGTRPQCGGDPTTQAVNAAVVYPVQLVNASCQTITLNLPANTASVTVFGSPIQLQPASLTVTSQQVGGKLCGLGKGNGPVDNLAKKLNRVLF